MEKSPPVASPETAAAAAEVASQFSTLVDAEDVGSIRQAQHLMWCVNYSLSIIAVYRCSAQHSPMYRTLLAQPVRESKRHRLGRLQDSNAVLTHFNEYSKQCFAEVSSDFASKTRLLKSMKADLDHVFMKLRSMKSRLAATYPDAFPDGADAFPGAMEKIMDQRPDLESPLD